jgi:sn-glycerol 3-phosphate transport system ATP-binding protein
MRLEIKQLQRELGVTSLYVTHDQVEAMTLTDRMIVMNAGRADQIGAPLDVYADPATRFVADFIGSPPTNFLKAETVGIDAPQGASVGIRPEHMRLSKGDAIVRGHVLYAEAVGAETLVHLRLDNNEMITVRQDGTLSTPAEGAEVGLDWPKGGQMLFDAEGYRL